MHPSGAHNDGIPGTSVLNSSDHLQLPSHDDSQDFLRNFLDNFASTNII